MDIITQISPYEYIGNSLGKINQNFVNLQRLPVALSAKYIQIDNFITSLRSNIVTDSIQVSGEACIKEAFRAEGDVILGSNTRNGERVIIKSFPVYLPHANQSVQSLIFGTANGTSQSNDTHLSPTLATNLYRTSNIPGRPDTLQTDGDFRVVNNFTVGGNMWLSGSTWIGDAVSDIIQIKSGNIYLDNITSTTQSIIFGTTDTPKLYKGTANTLEVGGSLKVTTNITVDGNTILGSDNTDTVTINGIAAGTDNTVVVLNASNVLKTDEIDPRVWGTTLLDGSSLTQNTITKVSDSDTLINSNITDSGTLVSIAAGLATSAPVTVSSTPKTVAATEVSLIFNVGSTCTVTLPTASSNSGRWLYVKTIASQSVISNASNVVPLAGGAASTAILSNTAGKWAWLQSDGSNWIIMAAN